MESDEMRNEHEIMELILRIANADERIRGVMLAGSRANPIHICLGKSLKSTHTPWQKHEEWRKIDIIQKTTIEIWSKKLQKIFKKPLDKGKGGMLHYILPPPSKERAKCTLKTEWLWEEKSQAIPEGNLLSCIW